MQALMAGRHYSSINAATEQAGRSQSFRQQMISSSAASQLLNGNLQASQPSLRPTLARSCSVLTRKANTLTLVEAEMLLYAIRITVHCSGTKIFVTQRSGVKLIIKITAGVSLTCLVSICLRLQDMAVKRALLPLMEERYPSDQNNLRFSKYS